MFRQIKAIVKKELRTAFGSPLAFIFLGTFLVAVMFIVFTLETFFVRNVADIRPLFVWMPILLIFLIAALTMRQWSEETRAGTQELLLTLPVSHWTLVLGKFWAVLLMVAIALALTLGLPLTISLLGNLDWGPVMGGYLAALLLSAAYASLGLFVSSRTDNQIVALIVTVLLGGVLYIVGTSSVTDFFGGGMSEILRAIGTGSRFESIQRGVLDLRDLVYYLSLTGIFLTLNVLSLDGLRWSDQQVAYQRRMWLTNGLIILNLLLLNVWLYPLGRLRLDMTENREFSLSQPTRDIVANLTEPLEITAYISENNHPLLLPLVPQIRDMLAEYEIAANGTVTAQVLDPTADPEVELTANQTYGIQPQPFQIADRYQSSVVNAYFDVLIKYGDEVAILNFSDLIQVDQSPFGVEVSLSNLEYDLTSTIKKTVFGFQDFNSILASLDGPTKLTYYFTLDTMPQEYEAVSNGIVQVAADLEAESNGRFEFELINLNDPAAQLSPAEFEQQTGIQPFSLSLFSAETFYAHMLLEAGGETQLLFPPDDGIETTIRTQIEAALKRVAPGFQKVVGVWSPAPQPQTGQGDGEPILFSEYNLIRSHLAQEYEVQNIDLLESIPAEIDFLVVLSPRALSEAEIFALDQYLLRGGKMLIGFSNYALGIDELTGLIALQVANVQTTAAWLAHHGIFVQRELVLDSQNQPFPVTTGRDVGGAQLQEVQAIDYPFFVDVRPDGMTTDNPALNNLAAVTLSYAQPVQIDDGKNSGRSVQTLLRSTDGAWLSADPNILPNFGAFPDSGFPPGSGFAAQDLAVSIEGSFDSFFADKEVPSGLSKIDASSADGRLIVIGSATFAEDSLLNLSASLSGDVGLLNLRFVQNMADWAVEDLDLLEIRSRGSESRVLRPLGGGGERFWELVNYGFALIALVIVYFGLRRGLRQEAVLPSGGDGT